MFKLPEQSVVFPVIAPGVEGPPPAVTAKICADEEQSALFAVTEMLPGIKLAVALSEFVVDVPVHPEGNDQVYEVAPPTAEILYVYEFPEQ